MFSVNRYICHGWFPSSTPRVHCLYCLYIGHSKVDMKVEFSEWISASSPKIHMNICCTWCNTTLTQLCAQVMMLPRKPMIAKTKPRIRLQPAVMMKLSWWFFLKAAEKTSAGSGWIWVPHLSITFFTLYSEPHLCITNLSAFLVITIVLNYRLSVSNYQCDVVGFFPIIVKLSDSQSPHHCLCVCNIIICSLFSFCLTSPFSSPCTATMSLLQLHWNVRFIDSRW